MSEQSISERRMIELTENTSFLLFSDHLVKIFFFIDIKAHTRIECSPFQRNTTSVSYQGEPKRYGH